MTFTPESQLELESAGQALATFIQGLSDGWSADDLKDSFAAAFAAQAVVDEIKADKIKAFALIVGEGMKEFGKS